MVNGYQSLHTTLVGPSGVNVEFQIRTEGMHVVAESGVAAHWLYKANPSDDEAADRTGAQWLQSLLDIQHETRDAAEFWDHVKIDLFPDAVYVFTPKSQIMALPRGATVVDFAYAIHSNIGDHVVAAKINSAQVPRRTELKNGDVVEGETATASTPEPAWPGFVRNGRPRPTPKVGAGGGRAGEARGQTSCWGTSATGRNGSSTCMSCSPPA